MPLHVSNRKSGAARRPDQRASARAARLRYINDRRPGIQRKGAPGRFRYVTDEGRRVGRADRSRIRALAIPPAWTDVWICPRPDGHLQATGRDARGRKQYLYHAHWHTIRRQTNFHRLVDFARGLPAIRRRVARDLRRPGLSREKVLAAVVAVLEHTHIRVGSAEYAEENQSYGLSTLRDRHVRVRGGTARFNFRGKSGVFHEIDLNHPGLAALIKRCQDLPGYDLFQYLDDAGEVRDVTSDALNDYLREISGRDFTAKDFRTWAGTTLAMEILRHHDGDDNEDPTEEALLAALDEVAAALGNTRSVCREHYVHPAVPAAYLDGTLSRHFDPVAGRSRTGLRPAEKAVVRLLKQSRR
jgi:DNA topoisomerase-1